MAKRPISIDDLLEFRVPSAAQIAPDGETVYWTERYVDQQLGKTCSQIFRGGTVQPATAFTAPGLSDTSIQLAPDGSALAFLRRDPTEELGNTRLCVMPTTGGEPQVLVDERGSFGAPVWSPCGRWLVVAFRRADALEEGSRMPLAIRVRRLLYKTDGVGYLPEDRFHLYRIDTQAALPGLEPLTTGDWDDNAPAWSPDGTRIAFLSNRRDNREFDAEAHDVFVVPAAGGEPIQCTRERGMRCQPVWAPDSSWIAVVGCVAPSGQPLFRKNAQLLHVSATGDGEESLTADTDRCTMNLTIDDLWGLDHWMQSPQFTGDGRAILVPIADQGTTWIGAVPVGSDGLRDGEIQPIVDDRVAVCFAASKAGSRLVVITTSPSEPGRVEVCNIDGSDRQCVAAPLAPYLDAVAIPKPTELRIAGPDGGEVHGWLLLPAGEGPFPMLLDIHGGPIVQFGRSFFHELHTFAAKGYAVLYVNPRGSQGYGEAFSGAIHGDWASGPHADLMAAVDHAVAKFPIDVERLGVLGGSYGGYMTTWVVAHTHRFKAACIQRTVSSMASLLHSDFGPAIADELEAYPWDDPQLYARMSPISYASAIETPVLILQGLADHRTTTDQGEHLYTTLRLMGKSAELVLFPGGTHDLSRNGPPKQRVERLRIIHEFFDGHLLQSDT